MITLVCILCGVIVLEAYFIAVLAIMLHEEHKYTTDIDLIDLVAFEKNWRDIHDGH